MARIFNNTGKQPAKVRARGNSLFCLLSLSLLVGYRQNKSTIDNAAIALPYESLQDNGLRTRHGTVQVTLQGQKQHTKSDASMNPILCAVDNVSIWRREMVGWFLPSLSQNSERNGALFFCNATNRKEGIQANKFEPFWLSVSLKLKLAVNWIPKVMCSSIRSALQNIEECKCMDPKNPLCFCPHGRLNPKLRENLEHLVNGMTRVLFIRDPIERALSAYANSNGVSIYTRACNSSDTCSFEQWVNDIYITDISFWRRFGVKGNEHFFTQVSIAQLDAIHYHYILRMSSPIDQDFFWNKLLQGAIKSKEERMLNPTRNKTEEALMNRTERRQKAERIYAGLSRKTLEQLHSLYREDFDLWETILQRGTPPTPDEITVYDIYKEDRAKWPRNI